MKTSIPPSISTQTYPDLSTNEESNQESGDWDLAGPNENSRLLSVIGFGFRCPTRPDSEHLNGDHIYNKLKIGSRVYDPYYRTYGRVTSCSKETVEVETRGYNGLYDSTHPTIWFFGDFVIQLNHFRARHQLYAQISL